MDPIIQDLVSGSRPQPEVRLLIGIPSRGVWAAKMGLCLARMCADLCRPMEKSHVWEMVCVRSSKLPTNRQRIVDHALAAGATHLLFLDDDQTFPETLAREWIDADLPVVAANVATKTADCYPTARARGETMQGVPFYSQGRTERFEEIWRIGTGLMMLRADVLRALPRPAFIPRWSPELDEEVGEDWVMVEHLEAAGIPVYVDNEISLEIGHVGEHIYTNTSIEAARRSRTQKGQKIHVPE